jgi:hypothetical protein
MKHLHILCLFAVLAWLGSGRTSPLAQEPPRSPLTPTVRGDDGEPW